VSQLPLTPEVIEEMVHNALRAQDPAAVVDILEVLATVDPERAARLTADLQTSLDLVRRLGAS
jgi:phage-related baseplate assembly protein